MENPVYNDPHSPSSTVVCERDKDHITFNCAHFDTKRLHHNMLNRHRWIMPYCTVAAVLIACGALLGLIVVYFQLRRSDAMLEKLIHGHDMKILNQTHALDRFKTELKYVKDPESGRAAASRLTTTKPTANPGSQSPAGVSGSIYVRWGLNECPNTSVLVYTGVAASGSSSSTAAQGGGSNYLCLTLDPEYGMVTSGVDDTRSRIYGVEYRNGVNFGSHTHLHGQDTPCATCMTSGGRTTVMMIPGRVTCPDNWTREYPGILMAARHNLMRSSYICVDIGAESRPGTVSEDANSALLFPVEGICGSGGGLPCRPYVDGNELQCAVCSM